MKDLLLDEEILTQYILGKLSSDAEEKIELQLFINGQLYERIDIIEDGLIEEYLFGNNINSKRKKELENFVNESPDRIKRLQLIKSLNKMAKNSYDFQKYYEDKSFFARVAEIVSTMRHIKAEAADF